jgi:hypothetical protein
VLQCWLCSNDFLTVGAKAVRLVVQVPKEFKLSEIPNEGRWSAKFHFTQGTNKLREGERPETASEHSIRVGAKFLEAVARFNPQIQLELADGKTKMVPLKTLVIEHEPFSDSVVKYCIENNLRLAQVLYPVGGVHHEWFKKEARNAWEDLLLQDSREE